MVGSVAARRRRRAEQRARRRPTAPHHNPTWCRIRRRRYLGASSACRGRQDDLAPELLAIGHRKSTGIEPASARSARPASIAACSRRGRATRAARRPRRAGSAWPRSWPGAPRRGPRTRDRAVRGRRPRRAAPARPRVCTLVSCHQLHASSAANGMIGASSRWTTSSAVRNAARADVAAASPCEP